MRFCFFLDGNGKERNTYTPDRPPTVPLDMTAAATSHGAWMFFGVRQSVVGFLSKLTGRICDARDEGFRSRDILVDGWQPCCGGKTGRNTWDFAGWVVCSMVCSWCNDGICYRMVCYRGNGCRWVGGRLVRTRRDAVWLYARRGRKWQISW